jgi:hypothetical protein
LAFSHRRCVYVEIPEKNDFFWMLINLFILIMND